MKRRSQQGYTYIGLLVLVAVTATLSAGLLRTGAVMQRYGAEEALLDAGSELANALRTYALATPPGKNPRPQRMEDLLRDPRFPKMIVRHLRRVPLDPMTGQALWGELLSQSEPGIDAFHSLSDLRAVRTTFKPKYADFVSKRYYREWLFDEGLAQRE
ncbi:MAG: type II secretion system protein [Rhodoferax sp.]|jgi:type II secretory pathway pseudopilin PulG|nr:type II secretion system protein [Rhodoferax sp.]